MGTIFGFSFLLGGTFWGSLLMFSLKFGGGAVVVVPESAGPGPASLLEEDNFSADGRSTASMICDMHSFTILFPFSSLLLADLLEFNNPASTEVISDILGLS